MPSASRWGSLPSCSCMCIDMRADMLTDGTHQQKELDQFPPHAYVDMCGRHVSVACVQTCVQTCAWTCVSTYTYVSATHACAHARAHCVSCARNQRVKPFEKGEFFLKKGEHPGTARIYPTAPSHPSRRGLSDFLMATRNRSSPIAVGAVFIKRGMRMCAHLHEEQAGLDGLEKYIASVHKISVEKRAWLPIVDDAT